MMTEEKRVTESVAVIGLGYIGLPTAVAFATQGISVVGVDINPITVDAINEGRAPFVEPDLQVALSGAVSIKHLKAMTTVPSADAFIIAVPTPFGDQHRPDLSYVRAAVSSVAAVLQPGNLVVLESTSPPGTTLAVSHWIAEARRDLRLPHIAASEADISIAHCPERVLPGRIMIELVTNDRVIGGVSRACAERAADLYRIFCQGECVVTDATTAELVKLAENSYRDVNIAFANELSLISQRLNIDVFQVIALANRHPRVDILRPGPGVGGHCIAVDPWFIVDAAPEEAVMVRTAREINDSKPQRVVDEVERLASRFPSPVISCLGLAFKPNIDDLRQSPAVEIVAKLAGLGTAEILVAEPHITELPAELSNSGPKLVALDDALSAADVIVLLVGHDAFGSTLPDSTAIKAVIDTCGGWQKDL